MCIFFLVLFVLVCCCGQSESEPKPKPEEDKNLFSNRKILCRSQDGTQKVYNNVVELAMAFGMSIPVAMRLVKEGKSFQYWGDGNWYQFTFVL
jgi:hypothetical protein